MDKLLERFFELRVSGYPIKSRGETGSQHGRPMEVIASAEKEQLEEMGLINVTLSEKGTLMATLPANVPGDILGDWLYFSCGYLTGLQRQKC